MHSIITGRLRSGNLKTWAFAATMGILTIACDKVPLLAPAASTITVTSNNSTVQANGTAEIRATVLEASGTPVQNGTTVSFTTNLGALSPNEARTINGVATVQFVGNGQSGTAEISAISGGAKVAAALKLAVGSAAATRVVVTASPNQISSGGLSTITARVTETGGNPLSGVSVSFSTDNGSLSSTVANTSASGEAQVTLTATRDATVTAAAAGLSGTVKVTVGSLPDIVIASSTPSPVERQSVSFTVTITPGASTETFQGLVVDFGDGQTSGPLSGTSQSVSHVYDSSGTYTVAATGSTTTGNTKRATTVTNVSPRTPLSFTLRASPNPATVGVLTNLTATFQGSPSNVSRYDWAFGDGTTATTAGNTTNHVYATSGTKTARVTVRTSDGNSGSSSTQVVVAPVATLNVNLTASDNPTKVGDLTKFTASFDSGTQPSNISGYDWDFGDGTAIRTTTGKETNHVYTESRTWTARVTVRTSDGNTGTGRTEVVVKE